MNLHLKEGHNLSLHLFPGKEGVSKSFTSNQRQDFTLINLGQDELIVHSLFMIKYQT